MLCLGARGEKLLFYPQMTQMTQIFLGVLFCRAAAEALKAQKLRQPKGWTTYGNIRQQNIFSFIACIFFFSV